MQKTKTALTLHGDVGVITLSNPPQNRLSGDVVDDLAVAVAAAASTNMRALVIRGDGTTFSFGGDVTEWPSMSRSALHAFIARVNGLFQTVEELPIPTIAAVHGSCMGGGFELALHCDHVVADPDAVFRFPEATIALPPLAGGAQRLAERIGRTRAARMVMLAEAASAQAGLEMGFVSLIAESGDAFEASMELARRLALGPTLAHQATKSLLRTWAHSGVGGADRVLLDLSDRALTSRDSERAVASAADALKQGTTRPQLDFDGE